MAAENANDSHVTPELKRPLQHEKLDLDALSEWELARLTSKTWSMEQE